MNDFLDGLAHRVFWTFENFCDATGHRFCHWFLLRRGPLGALNHWAFKRVAGL